jgi:hypothetical protein
MKAKEILPKGWFDKRSAAQQEHVAGLHWRPDNLTGECLLAANRKQIHRLPSIRLQGLNR